MSALINTLKENTSKLYNKGYEEGFVVGKKEGLDVSFDEGRQREREEFWGSLQKNGERSGVDYYYAFAYNRYTDNNFNPIYDIVFSASSTSAKFAFYGASLLTDTKKPIDATNSSVNMEKTFYNCENLKNIKTLFVANHTKFSKTFSGCYNLEQLIVEGEIGQKNFSLKDSPKLNTPSIVSIIESLSLTTSDYTITLSQTAIDNMVFPYTSGRTNITYNSWNELKNSKTNWNIELI